MLCRTLALAALLLASPPAFAQSPHADLALVLAVDVSGSMSNDRFHLEREGIAQALEAMSEEICRETIEIAIVEWSSRNTTIVPWTTLASGADIATVAAMLRTAPRSDNSLTNVGLGISAALDLIDVLPIPADRLIIDVSGDGTQNTGDLPAAKARDLAVSRGIVVNVIGGDQAFLIKANGFDDFARAIRQKLTLEIASDARPIGVAAR